jgi:hypothetical protein
MKVIIPFRMVNTIKQPNTSPAMKEYSKVIFSLLGATLIGIVSVGIILSISTEFVRLILIPPVAYGISLLISFIFQTSVCPSTSITTSAITNITVLLSTAFASFILFLESIPILSAFGYSEPISPLTGLPISREGAPEEYAKATDDNKHLKVQFFSSIVKAVLPVYYSEVNKTAIVYLYWMFWMSMLPLYVVLGLQGVC